MRDNGDSKNKSKDNSNTKWGIQVFFIAFILSLFFSYISANGVSNLSVIAAIFILLFVIFIGIIFDIIGVSVTVANEEEFHAKATKKVVGSKKSIKLIKNSAKVANICADVIGDICGVLSGALSAMVSMKIAQKFGISENIQYIISALVASLTISGKAIGKSISNKHSTEIVHIVGTILNKFNKEEKK
jgi:4-hydroxybenzoate polyprenyltransferase